MKTGDIVKFISGGCDLATSSVYRVPSNNHLVATGFKNLKGGEIYEVWEYDEGKRLITDLRTLDGKKVNVMLQPERFENLNELDTLEYLYQKAQKR